MENIIACLEQLLIITNNNYLLNNFKKQPKPRQVATSAV